MDEEPKTNIKNIDFVDTSSRTNMINSENNLISELFEELNNYEIYTSGATANGDKWNDVDGEYNSDISNEYIKDLMYNNLNTSIDNTRNVYSDLVVDVSNIVKSYNYNIDMYRNQKKMNDYTTNKINKFKEKNMHLFYDLDNKKKLQEIYTFYIYKYNAQIKILYTIMYVCIITIILNYLNKKFKFILNDTLFILLLGILLSYTVIKVFIQLYDIYYRSDINFDEYNYEKGIDGDISYSDISDNLDYGQCSAQIELYKSLSGEFNLDSE